jgi:hypothetical protein
VTVETRTGDELGSHTGRRVVALVLTRRRYTGRMRLDAVFDDGNRCTIMTGGRKVERLARWLAGRADVPLGGA